MNWHSNYLSITVDNGLVRGLYFPKWRLLPQIKSNQNLPNLNTESINSKYTKHQCYLALYRTAFRSQPVST
jgi:hypothetical protein